MGIIEEELKIKTNEQTIADKRNTEILSDIESKLPNFKYGEIWEDPIRGHKVACLDATNKTDKEKLMGNVRADLAIQDPPYNVQINKEFDHSSAEEYILWSEKWIDNTINALSDNASLYVWLGADIRHLFHPLPDFIIMMRNKPVKERNFITVRNQRGYGTQKNWMAVRQEVLYYIKGNPIFTVQYTDIPKILKGYYKKVGGQMTSNFQRSKSNTIRASSVWVDIQQIFYKMEENVEGCYAQKPLKAIERIIKASSSSKDIVIDFFSHSGSTLLAAERQNRVCYTMDISPEYCKATVARLLHYRNSGKTGWQRKKVLEDGFILMKDEELLGYLLQPKII